MMNKTKQLYIYIASAFLLSLLIVTFLHNKPPFWDEAYYFLNVALLEKYGSGKEFLLHYWGPAGPTFAWLHYLLKPITHLAAPQVRFVNAGLFCATLYFIYLTFKKIGAERINNIALTLSALSIPTIYTISGLALTEMPAIFFASIAIFFIAKYYLENKFNIAIALMVGLCLSFAILARQPFLLVLIAFPALFISPKFAFNFSQKKLIKFITATTVFALILPLYIFKIWGNIQPPTQTFTGNGLAPQHLVLALGYAGIHAFFINPSFFIGNNKITTFKELGIVGLVTLLLNIFFFKISFTPFQALATNKISPNTQVYYNLFCGTVLTVAAFCFTYFYIKKIFQYDSQLMVFFAVAFLLIVATSIKVTHQFSARYVVQAFPFLVLTVNYKRERFDLLSIVTLIVGAVLGLLSLQFYFSY